MVVQYNSDTNEWGGIGADIFKAVRNKFTDNVDASADIKDKLNTLNGLKGTTAVVTDLRDLFSGADENFLNFVDHVDMSGNVFTQYKEHLKKMGDSTTLFQKATSAAASAIKTIGATLLSMGISFVVGEVLHGVSELVTYSDTLADKGAPNPTHPVLVNECLPLSS